MNKKNPEPQVTREQAEIDLGKSIVDAVCLFYDKKFNDLRRCLDASDRGYTAKVKRYEMLFPGIKAAFQEVLEQGIPSEYLQNYYRLNR